MFSRLVDAQISGRACDNNDNYSIDFSNSSMYFSFCWMM